MAKKVGLQKRYTLVLPEELYTQIQGVAQKQDLTVLALLKKFIKLGLLAAELEETPGAALLVREGESESRIMFV